VEGYFSCLKDSWSTHFGYLVENIVHSSLNSFNQVGIVSAMDFGRRPFQAILKGLQTAILEAFQGHFVLDRYLVSVAWEVTVHTTRMASG
jgi:hypothetical protein